MSQKRLLGDAEEKQSAKIFVKIINLTKGTLIIFIFLALWEIFPRIGIINPAFLPPVTKVLIAWFQLIVSGELFKHILISMQRALTGFLVALFIAIPLGIAIGWYKGFAQFVDPLIQACRQVSAIALFPVFILFLGIGELSKTGMVAWVSLWPILLSTINGVKHADPSLIKVARSMGADNFCLLYRVILPGSLPSIMTGIRLGASSAILVLVAAEMIGSKAGLGFMIINSQYNFEINQMYAAIITIAMIGLIVNYALVWLEKKLTAWKEEIVPV